MGMRKRWGNARGRSSWEGMGTLPTIYQDPSTPFSLLDDTLNQKTFLFHIKDKHLVAIVLEGKLPLSFKSQNDLFLGYASISNDMDYVAFTTDYGASVVVHDISTRKSTNIH